MTSPLDKLRILTQHIIQLTAVMNTLSENVTESQTPSTPTASDVTLSEESSVSIDYFAIIDEIESNSLFESALTSAEYAIEIDRILAERGAVSSGLLISIIRSANLIARAANIINDPAHRTLFHHLHIRICNTAICLLPTSTKEAIREAIHTVVERTAANPVARPPSPHVTIPVPPPAEVPVTAEHSASVLHNTIVLDVPTSPLPAASPPPRRYPTRRRTSQPKREPSVSPVLRKRNARSRSPSPPSWPPVTIVKVDPYNNVMCRNCGLTGHRHKNCPTYHCRVCHALAPGHLSVFAKT